MLKSLLAEVLAIATDNLNMTACMLECTEVAAADLNSTAQQQINQVHLGLALAMQALQHDELRQLMEQSECFIPDSLLLN